MDYKLDQIAIVKLTDFGKEMYKHHYDTIDNDEGIVKMELWKLMFIFGHMCRPLHDAPFEGNIISIE